MQEADDSDWEDNQASDVDDGLEAQLNAQIAKALGIDADEQDAQFEVAAVETTRDEPAEKVEPEGYEFNLFSTGGAVPKVVLVDAEDADLGEGALANPRPASWYRKTELSAKEKEQFAFAALTGDDVYKMAQERSWGLELPWRVTAVKVVRKAKKGDPDKYTLEEITEEKKKSRPGKKQRIMARQKKRDKVAKAEQAAKKAEEKEEHIKEKKKRLNRIKKMRKRAKDKEKKAAGGDGGGGGEDSESEDLA